jgi:hypothetical protein
MKTITTSTFVAMLLTGCPTAESNRYRTEQEQPKNAHIERVRAANAHDAKIIDCQHNHITDLTSGMTPEQVLATCWNAEWLYRRTRTMTEGHTREEWVFRACSSCRASYLYFYDGLLHSFSD